MLPPANADFGVFRRQTIDRWINGELDRDLERVRYGPRPPVPTKLDPYKEIVRERLDEYSELTVVRLLEREIRAAGYPGGYTQLREYVRQIRPRPPVESPASGRIRRVRFAMRRGGRLDQVA